MRALPILCLMFSVSCAATPERPTTPPSDGPVSTTAAPTSGGTPLAHEQNEQDEQDPPTLRCTVNTDAPAVRRHLGLDEMGPTGSEARLPGKPGFSSFRHGADAYVGYICETWSADSDECDGSVVQVAELAEVEGHQTRVLWHSEPRLGEGNLACGKLGGNMFTHLAIGDWDGDGLPDISFSETHPTRPQSTVRLYSGVRYRAMLPVQTDNIADFDPCRPTPALEYFTASANAADFRPAAELPAPIKAALVEGYLRAAECPDAE